MNKHKDVLVTFNYHINLMKFDYVYKHEDECVDC
jgi:hypothetical protein